MRIIDASAAIKWFKPDEQSASADRLLQEHLTGTDSLFAPTLILYEIANALWYSKLLSVEEIERALGLLHSFRINYVNPDHALLSHTVAASHTTQLSIYDASYVSLANDFLCPLYTADRKLYTRAKSIANIVLL